MTYTYIKFNSQTMGEKAKNLLLKKGVFCELKRNPNPDRKQGCNFALFIKGNIYTAFDTISKHGINSQGIESFRDGL